MVRVHGQLLPCSRAQICHALLLLAFTLVSSVVLFAVQERLQPSAVSNQVADVVKSPAALTTPSRGSESRSSRRKLLNVQAEQKHCSCSCTMSCTGEMPSDFFMSCAGVNASAAPAAPPINITKYPNGACGGEASSGAITGVVGAAVANGLACGRSCNDHRYSGCGYMACFSWCWSFSSGVAAALGTAGGCAKHSSETSSCFPGEATVLLQDGTQKSMAELALRDMVAVRKGDGSLAFEDVYILGHKDATTTARFLQLISKPINANASTDSERKSLELTALHFIPVSKGKLNSVIYKRAKDVEVGDRLWVQAPSSRDLQLEVVTGISQITRRGLYNPFTLGGTIIVNGVAASAHSDWFLDAWFERFHAVGWLPTAYQWVLFPVRLLYYGLGRDVYAVLYERLDAAVDIADVFSGRKLPSPSPF